MDIIFRGNHTGEEMVDNMTSVLNLLKEKYKIAEFREISLSLTLMDERGDDVELVDSETLEPYRKLEVYRQAHELIGRRGKPMLKLVVDNTR